ncbi:hypothetical protein DL96DRAFT_1621160 [Flagelloscypha sp. PMI_526]|nr:hypothetical protein DL96DRAFT_1621160 [Flagelloscypha sp. PMI_526]
MDSLFLVPPSNGTHHAHPTHNPPTGPQQPVTQTQQPPTLLTFPHIPPQLLSNPIPLSQIGSLRNIEHPPVLPWELILQVIGCVDDLQVVKALRLVSRGLQRLYGALINGHQDPATRFHQPLPELPNEVIELILSHYETHPSFLSSCSFVCKSWVAPTQALLFRSITLNSKQSPRLLCWLLTRNRHLRSHIREITISDDSLDDECFDTVLGLLSHVHKSEANHIDGRIKRLTLAGERLLRGKGLELVLPFVASIEALHVRNTSSSSGAAVTMLSSTRPYFPLDLLQQSSTYALEDFHWLQKVQWMPPTTIRVQEEDKKPLKLFRVTVMSAGAFEDPRELPAFLAYAPFKVDGVEKMWLDMSATPNVKVPSEGCLSGMFRSLRKLSVVFPNVVNVVDDSDLPQRSLDLRTLTSLEHLTIYATWKTAISFTNTPHFRPRPCALGSAIGGVVASIPAPTNENEGRAAFRVLDLNLCLANLGPCLLDCSSWDLAGTLFGRFRRAEQFSSLSATINLCTDCAGGSTLESLNQHAAALKHAMPRLVESGMVRFGRRGLTLVFGVECPLSRKPKTHV